MGEFLNINPFKFLAIGEEHKRKAHSISVAMARARANFFTFRNLKEFDHIECKSGSLTWFQEATFTCPLSA